MIPTIGFDIETWVKLTRKAQADDSERRRSMATSGDVEEVLSTP